MDLAKPIGPVNILAERQRAVLKNSCIFDEYIAAQLLDSHLAKKTWYIPTQHIQIHPVHNLQNVHFDELLLNQFALNHQHSDGNY